MYSIHSAYDRILKMLMHPKPDLKNNATLLQGHNMNQVLLQQP